MRAVGGHPEVIDAPDVDAVLVLTPDHTHAGLACEALRAGKPVFVEKPLDITVERCDRVLHTARETGTRLYAGHNMRHMPVIRLMRDAIARGDIGEVKTVWVRHFVGYGGDWYFKDWHAERRYTTGLLLQKGAHDLDVLHWLAGGYTRQVQAAPDRRVPPVRTGGRAHRHLAGGRADGGGGRVRGDRVAARGRCRTGGPGPRSGAGRVLRTGAGVKESCGSA